MVGVVGTVGVVHRLAGALQGMLHGPLHGAPAVVGVGAGVLHGLVAGTVGAGVGTVGVGVVVAHGLVAGAGIVVVHGLVIGVGALPGVHRVAVAGGTFGVGVQLPLVVGLLKCVLVGLAPPVTSITSMTDAVRYVTKLTTNRSTLVVLAESDLLLTMETVLSFATMRLMSSRMLLTKLTVQRTISAALVPPALRRW